MKAICAWCQKRMPDRPGPDDIVTHCICKECKDIVIAGLDKFRQKEEDHGDGIMPPLRGDGVVGE